MTAKIIKIEKGKQKGMWLIIDKPKTKEDVLHTLDFFDEKGIMLPIIEEEIPAIMFACQEYLAKKS